MTEETQQLDSHTAEEPETEMTFLEHLEELRWRILYMLIGVIIGMIASFIFIDTIINEVLLLPATKAFEGKGIALQNLRPFGQVFLYFQVALSVGIIVSLPNIFFQLWMFIAPALKKHERKYIKGIAAFSTICFLSGIVFAYFVMLPMSLTFAAQFGTDKIINQFALDEYMDIIFSVMIACGLIFELPMISFFLSRLGILKPQWLSKYRRHAFIFLMIAAAFLSPGTDPVSMVVLCIPLFFLYEISIIISKISAKKRAQQETA